MGELSQTMIREENPFLLHVSEKLMTISVDKLGPFDSKLLNSNSRLSGWFDELYQEDGSLPPLPVSESLKKLISARRVLKELDEFYERTMSSENFYAEEELSFRNQAFNSGLLYLIAKIDGNEDTFGHSQLVACFTLMLTRALGINDPNYLINIQRGALIHDIGKIMIPESILRKRGPLTIGEREIIKEHPLLGYRLIEEFIFLKEASEVVLYHHESFDGKGYPFGMAGEEIPLQARIFSLADTLDAITSDRPYREGRSFEEACLEIEKGRGVQFDPSVVDAFFSVPLEKWKLLKTQAQIPSRFNSLQ